jgi:aconitate hydratase
MLIPQVVGFKLTGKLAEGVTATDLVLTVTQMLRKLGVVGKFVEFFGDGLKQLPLADRATIANMAPEYGATCGIFPVDAEALNYMRLSGRDEAQIRLVEAYAKAQGLWHDESTPAAEFSATLELELGDVKPSLAGPKRPQDRVLLEGVQKSFLDAVGPLTANRKPRSQAASDFIAEGGSAAIGNPANAITNGGVVVEKDGKTFKLADGAVVIAAITTWPWSSVVCDPSASCTPTELSGRPATAAAISCASASSGRCTGGRRVGSFVAGGSDAGNDSAANSTVGCSSSSGSSESSGR